MNDRLSKAEIRKDAVQDGRHRRDAHRRHGDHDHHRAVGDIARAVGGFATELFEIRDSARRAARDHAVRRRADLASPRG